MDPDERQHPQPGLRPVVGVAVVLGIVALAMGVMLALRPSGARPSGPGLAIAPPAEQQNATPGQGLATARLATSTAVLAVAVPVTTTTPGVTTTSARTSMAEQVAPRAANQTPRPLVIGTLQAPPRPTEAAARQSEATLQVPLRPTEAAARQLDATAAAADTASTSEGDANQSSTQDGTYAGLPVALPSVATLDGAEVPVGPASVRSDGARAFAQALLARARAQDAGLSEEPALRQVAEQALADALTRSTPTGRVVPTRVRQGNVTVQIDVVATLPDTTGASLRVFSSTRVPAIGVAVGVAGRVEPDYLPDLVAVAAVAYR